MKLFTSNNRVLQSSGRVMATSGDVIKDASMLYWFDPGRAESYSGNLTEFTDISGNGYHTKCTGTPVFTGNSFSYNPNDFFVSAEYIQFPNAGGSAGTTYNFTMTIWLRGNSSSLNQYPFRITNGGGNIDCVLNDENGGNDYKTIWTFWNSTGNPLSALPIGTIGGGGPNSDLLDDSWHCYTFRRDVDNEPFTEHFIDGVKIADVKRLGDQVGDLFYGGNLYIGGLYNFHGHIGSTYAYSRALSDAELVANYNAEKSRFTD